MQEEHGMTEPIPGHGIPANAYNPHCWITGQPEIGEGTRIGAFTLVDGLGDLQIGRQCDISSGAQVLSHSTVRRCVSAAYGVKSTTCQR